MTDTSSLGRYLFCAIPRLLLALLLFLLGLYGCHWWGWYEGFSELFHMLFISSDPLNIGELSFTLIRVFILSWVIGGICIMAAFMVGGSAYQRE